MLPNYLDYEDLDALKAQSPALEKYISHINLSGVETLKIKRHKYWVNSALATIKGEISAKEICTYWSQMTDEIVKEAWQNFDLDKTDLALFALGKWGATELNLSSDIDVFFVSKSSIDSTTQKKLSKFIQYLSQHDETGFCYRVDNDLRPGGRFGPLVSSYKQFEDYCWNHGSTWERVAYVRLRPVIGPMDLLEDTIAMAKKFTYRKFIDYSLIDEVSSLRSKMRPQIEPSEKSIDLKFELGGIRDCELFINCLQVIHGGREGALQTHSTQQAADILSKVEKLENIKIDEIIAHYWNLRELENFVQATNDQQIHRIDQKQLKDRTTYSVSEYRTGFLQIDKEVEPLFKGSQIINYLDFTNNDQAKALKELGFSEDVIEKGWTPVLEMTTKSKKPGASEKERGQFLTVFAQSVANLNIDNLQAFLLLNDFLRSTRARSNFYSILVRDQRIIEDLALLFSSSSYLGGVIASRPELIDSFVMTRQLTNSKDPEDLLLELSEYKLLTTIIASKEFLKDQNLKKLFSSLTHCADFITDKIISNLNEKYGTNIFCLALGKWGGQEMGLKSDLDFVLVCPEDPKENDFKVAKRFISYLTEPQKGGKIYDIDLRLRPSGNAGPIIVSIKKLKSFLATEAPTWQRLSFLKSRLPGNFQLNINNENHAQEVSESDFIEMKSIIDKLLKENSKGSFDLKSSRGGLIHIELSAQFFCLKNKILEVGTSTSDLLAYASPNNHKLLENYNYLRELEQNLQLHSNQTSTNIQKESLASTKLAQHFGMDTDTLIRNVEAIANENLELLKSLDLNF